MSSDPKLETILLSTPPVRCLAPDGVFDAFSWCSSTTLEWRRTIDWDRTSRLHPELPERLLFITRTDIEWLPCELAALHAPHLATKEERMLAPYAIDDATDALYERQIPARTVFLLATDNLNALFWALHDWVHFHNHGPFEERAWTEFQCDLTALYWVHVNRVAIGVRDADWRALVAQVQGFTFERFRSEGLEGRRFSEADVFALATPRGPA